MGGRHYKIPVENSKLSSALKSHRNLRKEPSTGKWLRFHGILRDLVTLSPFLEAEVHGSLLLT